MKTITCSQKWNEINRLRNKRKNLKGIFIFKFMYKNKLRKIDKQLDKLLNQPCKFGG